jgi:hypothetical protein
VVCLTSRPSHSRGKIVHEMRAFEVHLNKKRLCLAGIGEDGVLSAILDHVIGEGRDDVNFRVGGLMLPANEFVTWKVVELDTGDEVRIKVVESNIVKKPRIRRQRDPAEEKRQVKRYVRAMAKQFGWKITTGREKPKSN